MTKEKRQELFLKNLPVVFGEALKLYDGDFSKTWEFLVSPNGNLPHNRSPIRDVSLGGSRGCARVRHLIGRMEHGVYS